MSNNFVDRISPSVRIYSLIFLSLTLFLAHSIYLILFITTLTFILFIITNEKVNKSVNTLKKILLLLLIFLLIYIIIFKEYDIISICIYIYKLSIIAVLIKILFLNMDFCNMHQGIYGIIKIFKRSKKNLEKFSLDFVISLYFIKYILESMTKIKQIQLSRGKKSFNIKNLFLPCILYSINKLEQLQSSLEMKFYKLNYKKVDFKSSIIFIFMLFIFVISVFKEVV